MKWYRCGGDNSQSSWLESKCYKGFLRCLLVGHDSDLCCFDIPSDHLAQHQVIAYQIKVPELARPAPYSCKQPQHQLPRLVPSVGALLRQSAPLQHLFEIASLKHFEEKRQATKRCNLLIYKLYVYVFEHLCLFYPDAKITNICHTAIYGLVFLITVIRNAGFQISNDRFGLNIT